MIILLRDIRLARDGGYGITERIPLFKRTFSESERAKHDGAVFCGEGG